MGQEKEEEAKPVKEKEGAMKNYQMINFYSPPLCGILRNAGCGR